MAPAGTWTGTLCANDALPTRPVTPGTAAMAATAAAINSFFMTSSFRGTGCRQ
jgi:hypothetical protein